MEQKEARKLQNTPLSIWQFKATPIDQGTCRLILSIMALRQVELLGSLFGKVDVVRFQDFWLVYATLARHRPKQLATQNDFPLRSPARL